MRDTATNTVSIEESESLRSARWEELLRQAAQEVFEMMVGVPLRRCAIRAAQTSRASTAGEFTAVIGVAGRIRGVFAMRCSAETAVDIARGMVRADKNPAAGELCDALGEVCNLVVGHFKAKTGRAGDHSALSVPIVIHGRDYRVGPAIDGSVLECRMETAGGELQLRLDYRLT